MNDEQIIHATAEKVMGWERRQTGITNFEPDFAWYDGRQRMHAEFPSYLATELGNAVVGLFWNPLVSDADACAVLDRMVEGFDGVSVVWTLQNRWMVHLWNRKNGASTGMHEHQDRRRAICIAALKAIGSWKE